jgi:hypothetical protein
MGWYVRPGMGSKKAMASRVGTGDLDGQRRYQFASHAAREGDGGVRTISTGSLSWLNFFDCAWYVAVPTWNGGCTDGYIEPLEHAARKAAFAHLPSRSCTLAARGFVMPPMQKDGGRAAATQPDGTGTCTRSHTAAARRAWRPKRQQELRKATGGTASRTSSSRPAHEHHPGRKRHELSARSARCTHTPPSHRSGL